MFNEEAPLHVGASLVRIALCHALLVVYIAYFEVVVWILRYTGTAARAITKEVVAGGHLRRRHGKAFAHLRPTICLGDRLTAIAMNEDPPSWCLLLLRGKNNTLVLAMTIEAPLHVGASLLRIALCHTLQHVYSACFEVVVRIS